MTDQTSNPIGKLPRWQQIALFIVLCVAGLVVVDWVKKSGHQPDQVQVQSSQTDLNNYDAVFDLAMHGNYQAQRNVAFGFSSAPYHGQQKNSVLGCAWYLVVLNSGSPSINDGDRSNVETYCGKLEPDLFNTAKLRAQDLMTQIALNAKK
jgi:hypothetical protein